MNLNQYCTKLREKLDDLYDMIGCPTKDMSETFLELNKTLDNMSAYSAKAQVFLEFDGVAEQIAADVEERAIRIKDFVDGTKLDWNDPDMVDRLL
jgi:hypothetical protein